MKLFLHGSDEGLFVRGLFIVRACCKDIYVDAMRFTPYVVQICVWSAKVVVSMPTVKDKPVCSTAVALYHTIAHCKRLDNPLLLQRTPVSIS